MSSSFLLRRGALLLVILCLSCSRTLEKKDMEIIRQDGSTVAVRVELARTAQEQQKGYMQRKHIPEGTGMFFIFDKDSMWSFWMKNTPVALSIAYIDSRGTIREIYDMTPFSLASVQASVSVRYALEVPQGWFGKNGVVPGCKIDLP